MSSVTDEQLEANMRRWPGEVGILATQIYDLAKERKINETAIKAMDEENKKLLEEIDELKIEHLEACLTGLQQEKDFYKRTVLMSEETTKDLDDYVKDFEKPFERKRNEMNRETISMGNKIKNLNSYIHKLRLLIEDKKKEKQKAVNEKKKSEEALHQAKIKFRELRDQLKRTSCCQCGFLESKDAPNVQGTSDDSVTEEDEDDLEVPGFGQYRVQRKKPRIDRAE